jgi:hypothetical protein
MDATGNVVQPVPCESYDSGSLLVTAISVKNQSVYSRDAHPLRVITMLSHNTTARELVAGLEHFRAVELKLHGTCVQPLHISTDCGLNMRNAALLVFNGTTHDKYAAYLREFGAEDGDHNFILAEIRKKKWSQITWCLYHVQRAWREWVRDNCACATELTKSEVETGVLWEERGDSRAAPSGASWGPSARSGAMTGALGR